MFGNFPSQDAAQPFSSAELADKPKPTTGSTNWMRRLPTIMVTLLLLTSAAFFADDR